MRRYWVKSARFVNRDWWWFFFAALPWCGVSAILLGVALTYFTPEAIIVRLNDDHTPEQIEEWKLSIYIESFGMIAALAVATLLPIPTLLYLRYFIRNGRG